MRRSSNFGDHKDVFSNWGLAYTMTRRFSNPWEEKLEEIR